MRPPVSLPTLIAILGCLFCSSMIQAQPMEVVDGMTNPYTPENLISNVFLGDGLEVIDIQFWGDPRMVGFFKDGQDEIGIDRGIVMSSGAVANASGNTGVDNPGSTFASTGVLPNPNSPYLDDLQTLSNNTPGTDGITYEITFVPAADTLTFDYVWASEEYPEYGCSVFNDAFGFFISGPGINGPFTDNAENIALVPGTNLPVSIENVRPQNPNNPACGPFNEEFYNDNNNSANLPVYDGFTDVFTATAVVIPCSTYTIRLTIGDMVDNIFDSGVFLEAKSFGTGAIEVDIATVSLDGTITEGCSDAVLSFTLPSPAESDTPIDYTIFGDATNGVDYTTIPSDLTILQGDTMVSVPITAFEDGIDEGTEFIGIDVQRDICNRDTFFIFIRENELIPPELGPDTTICAGDTVLLDGTIDIPLPPPPTFINVNDVDIDPVNTTIISEINVVGVQPFQLGPGVIQSVCVNIDHNWLSDVDLFLAGPNGAFIELSTDNGSNGDDYIQTCFTPTATTPIDYISPPASGAPYTGEFAIEGVWSDLWDQQDNPTNGIWQLLMVDDANGFAGTLTEWSITFEPLYDIFYEWTPATGLSCAFCPDPQAFPDTTTTYVLTASDSYGCEVYDSVTITVDNILPAPDVFCGTITTDCITFEWTEVPGAAGYLVNIDNSNYELPNGIFQHTVCGLGFEQEVNIQVIALDECNGEIGTVSCTTPSCDGAVPSVVDQTNVECFGGTEGTVELTATGSFPPFEYTLGTETNSTGVFTDLAAGLYTVTVVNQEGCGTNIDVFITQPDSVALNEIVEAPVSCFGAIDGVMTLSITGGTYPFTYAWSTGQTDSIAVGVPAGPITVDITDANGCVYSLSTNVPSPPPITLTESTTIATCSDGDDGTATVMAMGGNGNYTYQWDANAGSQTTETAIGLQAGFYDVVVTDGEGCSETMNVEVTANTPVLTTMDFTDASCNGAGDGTATVGASGGGIGFYFYQWDANAGGQASPVATGLDVGTYYVTVTDFLGCETVDSVIIDAPNAIMVSFTQEPTSCSYNNDGQVSISVMGGSPGYTYAWSDAGAPNPDRNDLAAGPYQVTVSDLNGCFEILDIVIDAAAELTVDLSSEPVDCATNPTGSATAIPSGGDGDYTYAWEGGQTDPTAVNLLAGFISVTITDGNGCEVIDQVEVQTPTALELVMGAQPADCFNEASGQASVIVDGGTSPYTYAWDNGNVTGINDNIIAGIYEVTVTDDNGCEAIASVQVNEPSPLTASLSSTPVSCNGDPDGSATAVPDGGTGPYTYNWSNGQNAATATQLMAGSYQVTIADANGCSIVESVLLEVPVPLEIELVGTNISCNTGEDGQIEVVINNGTAPYSFSWSNNTSAQIAGGLSAGSYQVTVSDFAGCEVVATTQLSEPEALNANLIQSGSLCTSSSDGTAGVMDVFYGNTPADISDFTFNWNTFPQQSTANVAGLIGGQSYTVTITDPSGCVLVESITIDNPAPITSSVLSVTDASCFAGADGSATVGGNGGTGDYTYLWSSNAGSQTTATAGQLGQGTYTVTIFDGNGCETMTSVTIDQPEAVDSETSSSPAACFGEASGEVFVTAEGGTAPYQYIWSTGQTGSSEADVTAGVYYVTVEDANGCLLLDSVTVKQPEAPVSALTFSEDVNCAGGRDGMIELDAMGGTPPYLYSLDGQNYVGTEVLIALEAGEYAVYVQDANGCLFVSNDITISEPVPVEVSLGVDITVELGESVAFAPEVVSTNNIASYQWTVTGPGTLSCYDCPNPTMDSLSFQTSVAVLVTDENGCQAEDRVNLYVQKERKVFVPTAFSPNGDTNNDRLLVHGEDGTRILSFRVFDRWGELLFETGDFMINDPIYGWTGEFRGQMMNSGVYIWALEVEYIDGATEFFKGSTTLIR